MENVVRAFVIMLVIFFSFFILNCVPDFIDVDHETFVNVQIILFLGAFVALVVAYILCIANLGDAQQERAARHAHQFYIRGTPV